MKFTIEKNHEILDSDLKTLRNLYTPLIGPNSTCLYELLIDYSNLNNSVMAYFPIKELSATLSISIDEVEVARKKLEAVGLVRTFEKADNFHFIFSINKPLSPSLLKKNSFLFNMISKKISLETFERFEYLMKTTKYEKAEFKETTLKFQDMFAIDTAPTKIDNVDNTYELPIKKPESIDDAIMALTPAQFVLFLTSKKAQKSTIEMLNDLTNSAFSSRTINLITKYSYEVNGKVVKNHVRTIALDLLNKDLITYASVNEELEMALENKAQKFINNEISNKKSQIDINEIYSQIGDL